MLGEWVPSTTTPHPIGSTTLSAGVILAALRAVTESGEDLGARACCDALAAAEVVAALKGQALAWLPENARRWVDAHRTLDASALVIEHSRPFAVCGLPLSYASSGMGLGMPPPGMPRSMT